MSENQTIEYKQSWHDDYLKWICGFANALGGVLYVGKKDDGEIIHIENYSYLIESIPTKIRDLMGIICVVNLLVEDELHFLSACSSYEKERVELIDKCKEILIKRAKFI